MGGQNRDCWRGPCIAASPRGYRLRLRHGRPRLPSPSRDNVGVGHRSLSVQAAFHFSFCRRGKA
jgi:hypothetical protein